MDFIGTEIPSILTDRLIMYCDAKNRASYTSGYTWNDVSGNGNHLYSNTANISYNNQGHFNFNATATQGERLGASNQVVQRTGSFSISVVFRRNSAVNPFGDREQVFANAGGGDGFRCQFTSTGRLNALIGTSASYNEAELGGSNLGNNTWQMVTWAFDRAGELGSPAMRGYQNQALVGTSAITIGNTTQFQAGVAAIGYDTCCALLRGDIAAIMAYNKALSAAEVQYNYFCLKAVHSLV